MYTHEEQKRLREQDPFLNVRDEFRNKSLEEIKSVLESRRVPLKLAFVNALRDFNFSAIIRASNAFCCEDIVYSGHRRFDRRGAVGTNHYENLYHIPDIENFILYINLLKEDGYRFVVAESDIYEKSVSLPEYKWNDHSILMLGEEAIGVPAEFIDLADDVVYVPQKGSVRSMNVASTAHIMIYDYMMKMGAL